MSARKKKKGQKLSEMPFLDHLEELRWRIIWSVVAVMVFSFVGYYLVQRFDVVSLLKIPIDPYLPEDRVLVFTRPTDAFLIRLKLSILGGVILAFPIIVHQVWAFLAPALYEHERRQIVPAMFAGTGLFAIGVWMAYLWILPAALGIMLSDRFVGSGLEPLITAGDYFAFATQVILAFGVVFELPLIMVLLAMLGIVDPRFFARNRRFAVLFGTIVAAFVTPPDVFTMLMMLAPILLLYEVGIAIGRVLWRKREHSISGG
jgi:sec-independent protein translocase protein TatC